MPIQHNKKCENLEKKPLDELIISITDDQGVPINIPALDKRWTTRTIFANYKSLITANGRLKTGVEFVEWQHEAECYEEDMSYLLQCSHNVFWSYMVYQKNVIACVVSFLQHAIPFYIDLNSIGATPEQIALYEKNLNHTVRIICRLVTSKESPNAWIRKEHLAELIYSNYLITIPMLFDLAIAIGDAIEQNSAILRRIFNTVLQLEPKYKEDLLTGLSFYNAAFRSIQTQAENEGFEGAGGGTLDDSAETPYDDVALYTLDCAFSFSVILEICPSARSMCAEANLGKSIAKFYDTTIPYLYKNICQINENAFSLSWLNQARLRFLSSFRCIAFSFVDKVLANPHESLEHVEKFLALMTDCLADQTFAIDYERHYPIASDIEILKQACPSIDEFKVNFILRGYQQEAAEVASHTYNSLQQLTETMGNVKIEEILTTENEPPVIVLNTSAPIERDIDLEVSSVLDILPHLGTGFIRRVLSRYENSDQAVAAILEENLPPDLVYADQSEPYIPPDPQDKMIEETGVQHFNVYDGDAYDIMVQNNPACIIKRGKGFPNAAQNVAQLLDDKSGLAEIRDRYQAYSLVTEYDENDENAEYDDEYDDSYEALLESETRVLRSKELKAGLANVQDISEDDDNEENASDTENGKAQENNRMNFCENPEDVRARYEAKRQAKWSRKQGGNEPKHDVVGTTKGQGQDNETLRNRKKKETNKSSRANHNRKSGAAFKRSKGMIP